MDRIHAQYPLRARRVVVRGKTAKRDQSTVLYADFALCLKSNIPPVIVEVKKSRPSVRETVQMNDLESSIADVRATAP